MPEKFPTYRIDESALRSKLLGYTVEVNAAECNSIEQEVSALRFKKTIAFPKINLRIVLPVLLLAGLGTVIYFNLDAIKDLFSSAPETKIENKISVPVKQTPVVTTPTVAANPIITPTLTNNQPSQESILAKKQDSVSAAKKADTVKQENLKKPNPVMAQPPNDSAAKSNIVSKQDTSVQKADPPVKKKRKRRRRNANMEDLKNSTLQSNSSDDDVVVPQ